MLFRLAAAFGLVAHVINQLGNWLIGLVGLRLRLRVPFAAILSLPLLWLAGTGFVSGIERLSTRAEPQHGDIARLSTPARGPQSYYTVEGLAAAEPLAADVPIVDQDGFVVGTRTDYYYLLRDPDDPNAGLVVRSQFPDDTFRRRALTAAVIEDASFVQDALGHMGPVARGWEVDPTRYLDETTAPAADGAAVPLASALAQLDGGSIAGVAGAVVSPGRAAVEDGADAYLYLLADASAADAMILRSPHPPDAIPMEVTGLFLAPSQEADQALAGDWLAEERAALQLPDRRILYEGLEPPFFAPSFVAPALGAALAALLLLGTVIGYPIFRRDRQAERAMSASGLARPDDAPLDGLQGTVTGHVPTARGRLRVQDEVARLRRLPPVEYELSRWRYSSQVGGATPKELMDAASRADPHDVRLVLDVANVSALLPLRPTDDGTLHAIPGSIIWVRRRLPAARLRGAEGLDLLLAVHDSAARDRLVGLLGARRG